MKTNTKSNNMLHKCLECGVPTNNGSVFYCDSCAYKPGENSLSKYLSKATKTYSYKCTKCGVNDLEGSLPYCKDCYYKIINSKEKCAPIDLDVELMPLNLQESLQKSEDEGDYAKEHAYEKAEELGLEVVEPDNNILMIDLDSDEQEKEFYKRLVMLKKLEDGKEQLILDTLETKSKSGKKHVYMRISKSLKPMTRIGLQAILGSDPMREVLSLRRVLNGGLINTVLFESPEEYEKVKKWLNPKCTKDKDFSFTGDTAKEIIETISKIDYKAIEGSIAGIQVQIDSILSTLFGSSYFLSK